jgi:mutator protein MutT
MSEKMSKQPVLVVAAVFYQLNDPSKKEETICVFRRGPKEAGAGAWEFPGGKVEQGETEAAALRREILEELGIPIKVGELVGSNHHDYGKRTIHLVVYLVTPESGSFPSKWNLVDHDGHQWVTLSEIQKLRMAPADIPLIYPVFKKLKELSKV